MEGIKYKNLIVIGAVVIEIQGVEYGDLVVPVDNTLVCHTSFLAADTRPCVLIYYHAACSYSLLYVCVVATYVFYYVIYFTSFFT